MKKPIFITSALPYANGPLHIGHMVEYVQTDIYSRFLKLSGKNAIYCCADDTHGTPIEINAAKENKTPENFIKEWYDKHVEEMKAYSIEHDSYYTTNSPENKYFTELIFERLKEKGHIYQKEMELTYCENDKRFLPDRYVKGICSKCGAKDQYGDVCEKCNATYSPVDLIEPYCVICKSHPVRRKSMHYFFKLSKFSAKIEKWLKDNKKLQPEIRNQILSWVKDGLEDWCISRDGPYFGFKIPGEENKYFYVWLDAPIGYMSSLANYLKGDVKKAEEEWNNSEIIHFIGKDIIYFHLLFWPTVLMASGFEPPSNVVVHGFLNINGEKMSKSRGTFFSANEFRNAADPEFIRYFFASNLTHSMTDIDFDTESFKAKVNNELVANIANFVYRTLSFTNRSFDSKLEKIKDKKLLDQIKKKTQGVKEAYSTFDYRKAVQLILEISSMGNKYFQDNKPWEFVKENYEEAQKVITDCANIVKILSIIIKPILPGFSSSIESQLGIKEQKWEDIDSELENHKIGEAKIVLKKIEQLNLEIKETKAPEVSYIKDSGIDVDSYIIEISGLKIKRKNQELEKLKDEVYQNLDLDKLENSKHTKEYIKLLEFDKTDSPPSTINLFNLFKKNKKLPDFNTVADAYNILSLKYGIVMGAYDRKTMVGNIRLKIADGSEHFVPIGKKLPEKVSSGEWVYVDDNNNVFTKLMTKQANFVAVDLNTTNIIMCIQGNNEIKKEDLLNVTKEVAELITKFNGGTYRLLNPDKKTDPFGPFAKLNLKVAKITSVKEHPKADKLLVINIDLGNEKRQLVAGLKPYYPDPQVLVGQNIICVTNLEHANLRGEMSQGMLLAAETNDGHIVEALNPDTSDPGEQVYIEGIETGKETIKYDDFIKADIYVEDYTVMYKGKPLKTKSEKIKTSKVDNGKVR